MTVGDKEERQTHTQPGEKEAKGGSVAVMMRVVVELGEWRPVCFRAIDNIEPWG